MSKPRDDRQNDLFAPPLAEIINLRHPLVGLAAETDWAFFGRRFGAVCCPGPGQPPLPTRLVAGLFILKHMGNLFDEEPCERWVEDPYFQFFCGEPIFQHECPFDRSSLTRWIGAFEDELAALLQESLAVGHRTGPHPSRDREARLSQTRGRQTAPELFSHGQARRHHGRPLHPAHQFKRARRGLKFLRTRLGRIIRDIRRKIAGNPGLEERLCPLLAVRVRHQEQRQRGPRV